MVKIFTIERKINEKFATGAGTYKEIFSNS